MGPCEVACVFSVVGVVGVTVSPPPCSGVIVCVATAVPSSYLAGVIACQEE